MHICDNGYVCRCYDIYTVKVLKVVGRKEMFYMHHPTDRIAHTTDFVTPVMEHLAGNRNSSMGPPWGMDLTTHHTKSKCSTTELKLAPRERERERETDRQGGGMQADKRVG